MEGLVDDREVSHTGSSSPRAQRRLDTDQVTIRVLHEKLHHAGLGLARSVPFRFWLHEEPPVGSSKSIYERVNRGYGDLEVDSTAKWPLQCRRGPVPADTRLFDHDVRRAAYDVGEPVPGAVIQHLKAAEAAPKVQTVLENFHKKLRNQTRATRAFHDCHEFHTVSASADARNGPSTGGWVPDRRVRDEKRS